ncbi:MAG TPA: PIN domain-containing protein [Microthrixaceae bacterium]|nr:PIN domain-containing protein [Microthrixaceae bacterium]
MLLVDTSVWSLALRRDQPARSRHVRRFNDALMEGEVVLTGVVLQEVLQGLVSGPTKDRLSAELSKLSLLVPDREDHVLAAEFFTTCRHKGVQLATVDALLAALCSRRGLVLLSTGKDFAHAARHIDLMVWPDGP